MGCKLCGAPVSGTTGALNKKLINRGVQDFFCLGCLSAHFRIPRTDLLAMAKTYWQNGCSLFPPPGDPIRFRRAVIVPDPSLSAAYRALCSSAIHPDVPAQETGCIFLTRGDFPSPGVEITVFPDTFPKVLNSVFSLLEEFKYRRILLFGTEEGRAAALAADRGEADSLPPETTLSFFNFVEQLLEKQHG